MRQKNSRNTDKRATPKKRNKTRAKVDELSRYQDTLKGHVITFLSDQEMPLFRMQDIYRAFEVEEKELRALYYQIIQDLYAERRLERIGDGRYKWLGKQTPITSKGVAPDELSGRVDHVNANFAYIIVEGRDKDVLVFTEDMRSAIDGDTVEIKLTGRVKGDHAIGKVTKVVSHGRQMFVGILERMGKHAVIKPDNKRIYEPIEVLLKPEDKEIDFGTKVVVRVTHWPTRTRPAIGEIQSVLGKVGENDTEMHAILAEFELPVEFPIEVEQEVQAIPDAIQPHEIKGRRDFRAVTTFTIDPLDAKDFDDALSFQKLSNGNVEVGVHIADVSHYIKPGTELDKEAYLRATSVYLVDRTVPMLPEKLSNNLCSLRPNEDRLAFAAVFEITPDAEVVKEWFGRTIIHSDRRFTYEEAQEILDANAGEYIEELTELNRLAKIFKEERFAQGAVNFETAEVKFILDDKGKPLGVYKKDRKDAHKLIEEFMLLANKKVAEFVHGLKNKTIDPNTMIYRVHEAPDPDRLETFASFVSKLGYKLEVSGDESKVAKSLNKMLEKAGGSAEQNLLETLAVRTMSKARYSVEDLGHFGLAFERYSHFTSPIRRYPDVIAHRLLQHYLDGGASVDAEPIEKQSKHCSEREKLASEAERASIKYKQVEYMGLQDKNREYEGVISGVTEFGIFVEVTAMASEGLVRMVDLKDDFYELDKENYRIVGERTKRVFAFGDVVKVRVSETNLSRRSIDFTLVEAGGQDVRKVISRKPPRRMSSSDKKSSDGRRPRRNR